MKETISKNGDMKKEIEDLKQAQKNEKLNSLRKISQVEKSMKMLSTEIVEKDNSIKKMREMVEQRDKRLGI